MNGSTDKKSEPVVLSPEAQKLADVKERRSKLEKERAELSARKEAAEAVAVEERMLVEDEAFAKAQDEFGEEAVARVETRLGAIVLKKPSDILYRNWTETSPKKGGLTFNHCHKLVFPCLVYPTSAMFEHICKEQPATMNACADEVCLLAGVGFEGRLAK